MPVIDCFSTVEKGRISCLDNHIQDGKETAAGIR